MISDIKARIEELEEKRNKLNKVSCNYKTITFKVREIEKIKIELETLKSCLALVEKDKEDKIKMIAFTIVTDETINKYFPKGDKRRGDVLVILAKLDIALKNSLFEDGDTNDM